MKKTIEAGLIARAQGALARRSAMDIIAKLPFAKASGRPDGDWYKIVNKKDDEAEIFIYDEIGYWGTNAAQFVKDLRDVNAKTIHVRINSPGGSVFDGIAIYNALAQKDAKIVVHIDALAASIASVIAMAGDEIIISEAGYVMIHKPWSFVVGTDEDMIKEAGILKDLESAIVDIYVARTGGDRKEIEKWVADETWLKGQAAVDAGFADKTHKLVEPAKASARMPAEFFAAIFPNMPDDVRAALSVPSAENPKKIDTNSPRDLEVLLRENGYSRKQATDIVMKGHKAASREETADELRAREERERTDSASREETMRADGVIAAISALTQQLQTVAAIQAAARQLHTR